MDPIYTIRFVSEDINSTNESSNECVERAVAARGFFDQMNNNM